MKELLIILRVVRYNYCNCQTGFRTLRWLLNFTGPHSEKIMALLGCRMQNVYRKVLRNYDFHRGVNTRRKQMHYIILWGDAARSYCPINLQSGPEEIHTHVQNTPTHPASDHEAECGNGLMSCINHGEATLPVTFSHTVAAASGRNAAGSGLDGATSWWHAWAGFKRRRGFCPVIRGFYEFYLFNR